MKLINVLSLFDGISSGRLALERAGIKVGSYYASEIDKYAIQISKKNWHDIIQLGNVQEWRNWNIDWSSIDLLLAGFPCQSWSIAGKQLGDKDQRGALMWTMLDILNHIKSVNPSVKFLFENVKMKKENLDYVNNAIGVEPIEINSALLSAQNRKRLYWQNIGSIEQPEDKKTYLKDILENGRSAKDKSQTILATIHKENSKPMLKRRKYGLLVEKSEIFKLNKNKKNSDVTAHRPCEPKVFNEKLQLHHSANATDIRGSESIKRVYRETGKAPTLTTMGGGHREPKLHVEEFLYRKLTPIECERLQTLPDNYTQGVSNTQRYKAIGNGWTVDVVAHILKGLKSE